MITEIAFVLDRSGSMDSMRGAAIDGFNEFLSDQLNAPGDVRLTLVLFDNELITVHDAVPAGSVPPLSLATYVPRGSTALLDAIGDTIDRLGERFAASPDDQKPGHVAFAILTDGEENSSRRFTWQSVADRIAHQTQKYQWEFLFLGAGPDAIATASRMNIARVNVSHYQADDAGQFAASKGASRKILASRAVKGGYARNGHLADHHSNLDQLVHEEDRVRRL